MLPKEEGTVPSKKNLLIITACLFVFGLLFAYYLHTINDLSQFPEKTDFYKFYKSALLHKEGKSIYSPVPFTPGEDMLYRLTEKAKAKMNTLHPNMNAPFLTLFILPLAVLPFDKAFCVWSFFSLFMALAAVGLIAYKRPFDDYETLKKGSVIPQKTIVAHVLILWIIILLYFATWVNAASGQFGLFLLGMIIFVWLSARKEKYQLAGIILGIAMSVKIFLGLFLVLFAVQRRWKVLLWATSVFIVCNIISFIVFGFSAYKQYMEVVVASHMYINASWNASFIAFFTRIFGGAENIPLIELPVVAYGLACGLSGLLVYGLIWASWPRSGDVSPLIRFDTGFALTIASMLLISPFGWIYYFPPLIISLLVVWHASTTFKAGNLYRVLVVAAWILSCLPVQLINSEEIAMNDPVAWFTTSGYYFYSLIIFCFVLLQISRQSGRIAVERVG